jgi:hypothetical protein
VAISKLAFLRLTRQFKGLNEGPISKIAQPPAHTYLLFSHLTHLTGGPAKMNANITDDMMAWQYMLFLQSGIFFQGFLSVRKMWDSYD